VNIDTRRVEDTQPDVVVAAGDPLPYEDRSAARVYLGHVLEHVPWPHLPTFLAEVRRVLDGDLLVVGPDSLRTLERWKAGLEPGWLVEAVLEHAAPVGGDGGWPEAAHHWNCHEARVVDALGRAGFEVTRSGCLTDLDVDGRVKAGWPITNPSPWQFAVAAR
jgi:ubiquinone/menaquinone biosynthesis C-methylase UbiE